MLPGPFVWIYAITLLKEVQSVRILPNEISSHKARLKGYSKKKSNIYLQFHRALMPSATNA
jgi:hypothetical protein